MSNNNYYILSTFNEQFSNFIEDIERVFPDDNDISVCKNALLLIRKTNPKLIITVIKSYFLKYKKEINDGNIEFFVNKDYANDISFDEHTSNTILNKIDSLRNPIKLMNSKDQEKVIQYLRNLLKLCEIYN